MFLKKFKAKRNITLKSSDVKKLFQRLQKDFPEVNIDILLNTKVNVTQLKLSLHNESQAIVYCWDKLPTFFELDDEPRLIPTVYALWQVRKMSISLEFILQSLLSLFALLRYKIYCLTSPQPLLF